MPLYFVLIIVSAATLLEERLRLKQMKNAQFFIVFAV